MRINEVAQLGHYDPNARYLHGGPQDLEGARLKRYGKHHSDAGALFFCKDTPGGRWYAGTYGERVWICRLRTPAEQVFDFSNPRHRQILRQNVNPQEWANYANTARNGHLDWSSVDEEVFEPLGFRGVLFLERPAGMQTGLPPESGFAVLPEDVLSVGLFHPEDADIIGSASRQELWSTITEA